MISIRMYGMAAVADTTWQATAGPDAAGVASVAQNTGAPRRRTITRRCSQSEETRKSTDVEGTFR